jgi:gamma-glutamyltranspeptidase/glutathione hydrolase
VNGLVVAAQPQAVEEGVKVLKRGGNAVDAAVATAFTQTAVDPYNSSIAGLGVMHLYLAETGEEKIVNFWDKAPLASKADMFEFESETIGGLYWVKDMANQMGHQAVAVPGTLAGLCEALSRYGTMSLRQVMQPAIRYAREGVPITAYQATAYRRKPREGDVDMLTKLSATPAAAAIHLKNGQLLEEGDILVQEDMARTYERIAEAGPDIFYRGEIARTIAEDFAAHGGLITEQDLAEYKVEITDPIFGTYRGYQVASNIPPGSGMVLIEMLNILEAYDLKALGPDSAQCLHLVAEAMRLSFDDRAKYLGDPKFVDIPVDMLTAKDYAAERRKEIGGPPGGAVGVPDCASTTHLSVMDPQGNVVSMTHTNGGGSSGVVTSGLGFLYNNFMHRFYPVPGHPNSIAPGKSRNSSLTPTILFKDGKPTMAIGASGGFGIITGILQTILNVIDHGMTIIEAVYVPRIHAESKMVQVSARIPTYICEELERKGHEVRRSLDSYVRFSGNVNALVADWEKDRAYGGADPRQTGMTLST